MCTRVEREVRIDGGLLSLHGVRHRLLLWWWWLGWAIREQILESLSESLDKSLYCTKKRVRPTLLKSQPRNVGETLTASSFWPRLITSLPRVLILRLTASLCLLVLRLTAHPYRILVLRLNTRQRHRLVVIRGGKSGQRSGKWLSAFVRPSNGTLPSTELVIHVFWLYVALLKVMVEKSLR